jgi:hypothetical protein
MVIDIPLVLAEATFTWRGWRSVAIWVGSAILLGTFAWALVRLFGLLI